MTTTVNLKGLVRYEGTHFRGWQVQPDGRTVQGELERCLSQIAGEAIRIVGASRTDAGVHALGQVFSFRWPEHKPFERLARALSCMLSPEIRVVSIEKAEDDFHARFSAKWKRYAYALVLQRETDPFLARYAWFVRCDVDMGLLTRLAQQLVGTHDFAGFQSAGSPSSTTVRTVRSISVKPGYVVGPQDIQHAWYIEIEGDGFLYHMVRNIVGTLIEICSGKRPESWLHERLQSGGPFVGLTAPAHGLFLVGVYYEG